MIKTKNFNPEIDTKLLCTCGHELCDRRSVNQYSLDRVQLIRDDVNRAMPVTSGGRCQYHPNEVRKSKPGDHQLQYAVDVYYGDDMLFAVKLMVLAGRHGATRVALGKNFVHIAFTPTTDRSVPTWSYR